MTSRKDLDGDPLWRVFHHASSNTLAELLGGAADPPQPGISYAHMPGAETIDVATDRSGSALDDALRERRSPTAFSDQPITHDEVAALVDGAAGITAEGRTDDFHRRAYPSGGALYPLELYAAVLDGADIDPGLYHYNVRDRTLERLVSGPLRGELEFVTTDLIDTAPLCLFLTARMERTTQKYGDRGYRYALMEAGHVMQNVCLIADHEGLGCRPIAGFAEAAADEFLGRGDVETCLYAGVVGESKTPRRDDEPVE
jgi:SagB-type dehydrogenase family enzyme